MLIDDVSKIVAFERPSSDLLSCEPFDLLFEHQDVLLVVDAVEPFGGFVPCSFIVLGDTEVEFVVSLLEVSKCQFYLFQCLLLFFDNLVFFYIEGHRLFACLFLSVFLFLLVFT